MRLAGHNLFAPAVVYSEGKQYDVNGANRKESQEVDEARGWSDAVKFIEPQHDAAGLSLISTVLKVFAV
jgi:hypothetical protein